MPGKILGWILERYGSSLLHYNEFFVFYRKNGNRSDFLTIYDSSYNKNGKPVLILKCESAQKDTRKTQGYGSVPNGHSVKLGRTSRTIIFADFGGKHLILNMGLFCWFFLKERILFNKKMYNIIIKGPKISFYFFYTKQLMLN